MQPALVLGTARATAKHESLVGQKLLLVQPLGIDDAADGPPLLSLDQLGARRGDRVMITSDGSYVRELLGTDRSPVRWSTLGIVDS